MQWRCSAWGEARPDSDIDLLIVVDGDEQTALDDCLTVRNGVEKATMPLITLAVFTPQRLRKNFLILLDIADHGLILHDPQGALTELLNSLQQRLLEWGSRKVVLPDGSRYWQLKPDLKLGEVLSLEL